MKSSTATFLPTINETITSEAKVLLCLLGMIVREEARFGEVHHTIRLLGRIHSVLAEMRVFLYLAQRSIMFSSRSIG